MGVSLCVAGHTSPSTDGVPVESRGCTARPGPEETVQSRQVGGRSPAALPALGCLPGGLRDPEQAEAIGYHGPGPAMRAHVQCHPGSLLRWPPYCAHRWPHTEDMNVQPVSGSVTPVGHLLPSPAAWARTSLQGCRAEPLLNGTVPAAVIRLADLPGPLPHGRAGDGEPKQAPPGPLLAWTRDVLQWH